jgi:hypothetical protein
MQVYLKFYLYEAPGPRRSKRPIFEFDNQRLEPWPIKSLQIPSDSIS